MSLYGILMAYTDVSALGVDPFLFRRSGLSFALQIIILSYDSINESVTFSKCINGSFASRNPVRNTLTTEYQWLAAITILVERDINFRTLVSWHGWRCACGSVDCMSLETPLHLQVEGQRIHSCQQVSSCERRRSPLPLHCSSGSALGTEWIHTVYIDEYNAHCVTGTVQCHVHCIVGKIERMNYNYVRSCIFGGQANHQRVK